MKLVVASGKSIADVAKADKISDSVVSTWVRQARVDAGQGLAGALTTEERAELAALRSREARSPNLACVSSAVETPIHYSFFASTHGPRMIC